MFSLFYFLLPLQDYTLKHKKSERTWRTGGRKVNNRWWWYGKSGSTGHPPFNYTAWAPGHPWYYDSLALVRYDGSPKNYIWRGVYASSSTPSRNAYPFICEMKANGEYSLALSNKKYTRVFECSFHTYFICIFHMHISYYFSYKNR